MSTQAQQSANAASSRVSTGPTTEAGKQKAAQNSVRHYLTAKQSVVAGESPEDYTELHHGLQQAWTPVNSQESLPVEQIAQNAWRVMRARRLEAALFTSRMPGFEPKPSAQPGVTHRNVPANPEVAMLRAFFDNTKEFDNLRRYATSIERAYRNSKAELTKLQNKGESKKLGPFRKAANNHPQ